jgi:hypothetical protein
MTRWRTLAYCAGIIFVSAVMVFFLVVDKIIKIIRRIVEGPDV